MESNLEISRIPRPKGTTNLAKAGLRKELTDKIVEAFFQGMFPFRGAVLNIYQFAELFNVPIRALESRLRSGIADPMMESEDLAATLSTERLQQFSQSLARIGNSDFLLNRLLATLSTSVLGSRFPDPLLTKEFNSAIGNQIRLTEAQLKVIGLINQSLQTVPVSAQTEAQVTRMEVLEAIRSLSPSADPLALEAYIEGSPSVSPPHLNKELRARDLNREAQHSYQKAEEIRLIPAIADIPVLPR